MPAEKNLKFQFTLDEQSFQRVKRALNELLEISQKLGKTLSGVQLPGAGGGGAGILSGGTVGGGNTGGGAPGAAGGRKTFDLTSALTQNANAFRNLAATGKSSMLALSGAVNQGLTDQERKLDRTIAKIQKLNQAYMASGGTDASLHKRAVRMNQVLAGRTSNVDELRSLQTSLLGGSTGGAAALGLGPAAGIGAGAGIGLGGAASQLGFLGRQMGLPMQLLYGGVGPAGLALMASGSALKTSVNQWYNDAEIRMAQQGSMLGDLYSPAQRIRGRNLNDIRAARLIGRDPQAAADYAARTDPSMWQARRYTGFFGAVGDAYSAGGLREAWKEATSEGDAGEYYKARMRARGQEFRDQFIAGTSPRYNEILDEAVQGAHGKLSLQRALGIGDGYRRDKKGNVIAGSYRSNAETYLNSFGGQFSQSEILSAVQGVTSAGSRAAGFANGSQLVNSVLQAQGHGIAGAANIGGIMSRGGASGGVDFVNQLRRLVGSGGVDESVVSLIGNVTANYADRTNTAAGFAAAPFMAAALAAGTSGADGAMVARQNIGGWGALQAGLSGGPDAWQRARQLQIAMKVAPNLRHYGQQQLATGMDPATVSAALAGGKIAVTPDENSMGITAEMKRNFAIQQRMVDFGRVIASGFDPNSGAGKFASGVKAFLAGGGTNIRDFFRQQYGGKDGKLSQAEQRQGETDYAAVLRVASMKNGQPTMTVSESLGLARLNSSALGARPLAADVAMAGARGGESIAGKQAGAEAEIAKKDLADRDQNEKDIAKDIALSAKAFNSIVKNAEILGTTIDSVNKFLKPLEGTLKRIGSGGGSQTKTTPK